MDSDCNYLFDRSYNCVISSLSPGFHCHEQSDDTLSAEFEKVRNLTDRHKTHLSIWVPYDD